MNVMLSEDKLPVVMYREGDVIRKGCAGERNGEDFSVTINRLIVAIPIERP